MAEILFKKESYDIIGLCMKVHKELGHGFLESVYQEALEIEFQKNNIPFKKEMKLPVYYNDQPLKKYFRADFICYESIVLELKATKYSVEADIRQTLNNIKATNFKLGILINFGSPSLTYKRVVN
jgi:GxxExxY protein